MHMYHDYIAYANPVPALSSSFFGLYPPDYCGFKMSGLAHHWYDAPAHAKTSHSTQKYMSSNGPKRV